LFTYGSWTHCHQGTDSYSNGNIDLKLYVH
jgi:hypothetical protein